MEEGRKNGIERGKTRGKMKMTRTRTLKTSRPVSHEAFLRARSLSRFTRQSAKLDWEEDEVVAPDVASRQTLLELAKMTNNAYLEPGEAGWYDLGGEWNVVRPRTRLWASSSRI